MWRFAKELLRDRGRMVGRYDSRYKGIDADDAGEYPEYDASAAAIFGPFTAAINDYLRNDLKVEDEQRLRDSHRQGAAVELSGGSRRGSRTLRTRCAQSMSANPFLKLFVASGYYDLATPPATVNYSVEHLRLPAELQKNIDHKFYEGGHMMYIYEPSMEKLRKDLEAFYETALKPGSKDKEARTRTVLPRLGATWPQCRRSTATDDLAIDHPVC